MVIFSKKLKLLKKELLKWNVEIFWRVEIELKTIEASLVDLEEAELEEELLHCKQRHTNTCIGRKCLGVKNLVLNGL